MNRHNWTITLAIACSCVACSFVVGGCGDPSGDGDEAGPVKSDLPQCDDDFACYYDGYVAQAVFVNGEWVLAASPGDWVVRVTEPRAGGFSLTFEGEYVDALLDCVYDQKLVDDAALGGSFGEVTFEQGCKTTRRAEAPGPIEFNVEIGGEMFAERHQPEEPPALSITDDEDLRITPENPEEPWFVYVVEDRPGLDGKTFFKVLRGTPEYPEQAVYPSSRYIDAPFSVYAVGINGGASQIEYQGETITIGLAVEVWERIGGGEAP